MAEYEALIQNLRSIDEYDTGYAKLIYDAADAIEELEKYIPRWVSVTERLPDNIDEEVLVCNERYGKDGTGFATIAVYNGNGWLECWERKQYLACITHWMQLPAPPKEET